MARTSSFAHRPDAAAGNGGFAWASVVAILFATVAAISFALDQSVTLSDLAPPATGARR